MLRYIRVIPLAAESFGTRSMCTYVETPDVKVLLDAGVSLCPDRFHLPPHPREFKAIEEARKRIAEAADEAEVVTLSHYHFDHHTPSYEDWLSNWTARNETAKQIYADKTVLVKNPKEKINYSQRRRGWMFQKTSGKYAKKLEIADGKTFTYGKGTILRFSEPVFHGPADSALGWVLMTTIECRGERFMHAPDVQGPMVTSTLKIILREKPQLLMIGGPPLYLAGFRVDDQQIQAALENFGEIVEVIPNLILDHHIMRDEDWREKTKTAIPGAWRRKSKIATAAEYLGEKNLFLEANRKRLFAEETPSRDFEKWMNQSVDLKKHVRPPV
jgi:predicted metallo-beta-lactamase superfamily hydrolase